jgi:hypothetical protein
MGATAAGCRSAPELAPGLLELLTLDMPSHTVFLDDGEVARLGGQDSLREAALANLRALPAPMHLRIGTADAHFEAIRDDSHFTASRVLVMPDLLSRVLGTDAPYGVLAAMPARHWAFIHVLADKTAGPSLLKMAAMARVAHGQEQGPISPEVFWWRDGGWMPVPSAESGGEGCSTVTRRGGADDILGATAITGISDAPGPWYAARACVHPSQRGGESQGRGELHPLCRADAPRQGTVPGERRYSRDGGVVPEGRPQGG